MTQTLIRYYVASTPKTGRVPTDTVLPAIVCDAFGVACRAIRLASRGLGSLRKSTKKWFCHQPVTISGIIYENEGGTRRFVHVMCAAAMEGAMHDSRTVANRFLRLAHEAGRPLTPMQVLKLVYIAHGWMLGLYGRPLIKDDVQAWQYGPVIPRLYNAMRTYGGSVVTEKLAEPISDTLDEQEDDIVKQVFNLYGSRTGTALSRLTHADGTPWSLTYEPGSFGLVIPTDTIREHYEKLAAK